MPSFRPQAHSTPARGSRRQQIVIPPGLVDPNNTTVVEIPPNLHNIPTVVARRTGSGAVPLIMHHHRHRSRRNDTPSSPCEAAGGPEVTISTTSIKSVTNIIDPDECSPCKPRPIRRTPRSPCRCRNRSRCPTLSDDLEISEERERCRLERDLIAFQKARRRLIMNISKIGNESLSPARSTNTCARRSRSCMDQTTSILEEIETIEDIDTVSEDTRVHSLYPNCNASPVSRSSSSSTRYERSVSFPGTCGSPPSRCHRLCPGSNSLNLSKSVRCSNGPLSPDLRQCPNWETSRVCRRSPSPPRCGRSLSCSRSRSLCSPGRPPRCWVKKQYPACQASCAPRRPQSQTRYSSSVSYSDEDGIDTQTYTVDSQLILPPAPPRRSPCFRTTRNCPRRVLSETRIIEQESVKSPCCPSSRRNINAETYIVETESPAIPKRPTICRSPSKVIQSDTYSIETEAIPRSNMFTRTIKSETSLLEYEDDDGSITPPIEYAPDSPYYRMSRTVIIDPNETKSSCRSQPQTWRYSTQIGPTVCPYFSGISSIAANESRRSRINDRTYDVSISNRRACNIPNSRPRISESFHRSQTVIIDPNVTTKKSPSGRRRRCPCANNKTRPESTSWRTSTQRDQTVLPDFSGISSIETNETTRSGINGRTYNISNMNRTNANQRTYNVSNVSRAGGQINRSQITTSISGVAPLDNQSNPSEYSRELYRLVSETSVTNKNI